MLLRRRRRLRGSPFKLWKGEITKVFKLMIKVTNIEKVFIDKKRGKKVGVAGISFHAHAGEIFGLLGPNGAGKTTALRMLATILRPTSGSAVVAGHDLLEEPELVRRNVGFLCFIFSHLS